MKQGERPAEEFIEEWKLVVRDSNINSDPANIDRLRQALNPTLVEKVMLLGIEPTTTADWYARAIQVDNQYRRTKAMMERYRGKREANKPRMFYRRPERQYEPMDTSAGRLTVEEQRDHFEKRLCFNCHKPGHLARDCRGG